MPQRKWSVLGLAAIVGLTVVACQKSQPLSPTVPTGATTTTSDGSTLKVSKPTPSSPVNSVRLDTFTMPALSTGAASFTQGGSGTLSYHFRLFVGSSTSVTQEATVSGTSWTPTVDMQFDTTYQWDVRAEGAGGVGPWSDRATFISPNGGFLRGKQAFDPLTNGRTVASRIVGGHFVTGANGGWQADALTDGLDYDIDTCDACTVEFDVTNFGAGEGQAIQIDVKWFSMGDRVNMTDFLSFRNSPWKMHIEQRSDGDGTGMQLIWRNGAADEDTGGDPEYGDHRGKFLTGGPAFGHSFDNKVWHFTIQWDRTTYHIYINELGKPLQQWWPGVGGSSGFFGGGHAYTPPGHRIELGCSSRGETMIGARFRNLKITPN